MKIDIIGSKFSSKLTEFRSFPYSVNNFIAGTSLLSLFSEPYPKAMKDINTSDIVEISTAHRDLNKANLEKLKESNSEVLMIDLLSELNDIVVYNGDYFNRRSFELIDDEIDYQTVRKIDQFRALRDRIKDILTLAQRYDKVILIDVLPNNDYDSFISGLYELLYNNIENKLVISAGNDAVKDILNAPLEIYDAVNQQLRKINSDNYENQLLFDEKLEDNILSVFMNYVEERHYIYELYKGGRPFKKSHRTDSRYCQFHLDEAGKYRIRVTAEVDNIKPRFSDTFVYNPKTISAKGKSYQYVEMPSDENLWMLNLILSTSNFKGLVGNPFRYVDGYNGLDVFLKEEVNADYIKKEDLLEMALNILYDLNKDDLETFIVDNQDALNSASNAIKDYISKLN
ncbi:DUF6270 domain-containing protein [Jeotgalicoccus sp. ATCC 8456]|uniref:DUF6270 domain-containing protein n=1 Tax=Jeotgalicoccus sp. ATCC 8456 TaxID=946435 RepID=UPI0018E5EDFD|nr:DUF6270 domain-containing protein [Jeotgalicoccus sp. ATCC 8456]QQD85682.1 hypothetical protein JEM45_03390 [Jeotgalicoccus sp. ATCC 8456]